MWSRWSLGFRSVPVYICVKPIPSHYRVTLGSPLGPDRHPHGHQGEEGAMLFPALWHRFTFLDLALGLSASPTAAGVFSCLSARGLNRQSVAREKLPQVKAPSSSTVHKSSTDCSIFKSSKTDSSFMEDTINDLSFSFFVSLSPCFVLL